MNTFTELLGLGVSVLGQHLKSMKNVDSRLVVLAMMLAGIGGYAVLHHPPMDAAFWQWLDESKLYALALPGVASIAGAFIPGMQTDSK